VDAGADINTDSMQDCSLEELLAGEQFLTAMATYRGLFPAWFPKSLLKPERITSREPAIALALLIG
jgi:hypothetical protein